MKKILCYTSVVLFLFFTEHSFSQDTTDGIVWEPPIQLTDTSYSAYMPKIALSGDDTIHVTWKEDLSTHRLPYARCIDGVWEPLKDLIQDTLQYPRRFNQNIITAEGNNVYIFSNGESQQKRNVMSKSTDAGTTWFTTRVGVDSASGLLSANVHQDTVLFVYHPDNGYSYTPPFLMVSTDAGLSWIKRPDTLDGWTRTALTPGTLHLVRDVFTNGAQEKLYLRSTDLGNSWQKAETLSTVDGYFAYEHALASNSVSIDSGWIMVAWRDAMECAGIVGCTIAGRESWDTGNKWGRQEIYTEQPRGAWPSIALNENKMVAVSWRDEIDALGILNIYVRIRTHPDTLWGEPISVSLINNYAIISDITLTRDAIHVVWEEKLGSKFQIFYRRGVFLTTDVKENNNELPKGFSLSQNYPNPFNPSTKIKYKLPSTEYVSIKVYDVFGREVATLVNEKKQPGEYEVEWNPDGFASGVYFIRMVAGKYISTIKAISMK
jgi:hypothetical protein